jgi:hypothetical protein
LLCHVLGAHGIVAWPVAPASDCQGPSTGGATVDSAGVRHVLENLEPDPPTGAQLLPPAIEAGHFEGAGGKDAGESVAQLREDLRKLAADLVAVDRRDAAQHGVLKGEIAHLVRRIARLEAIPRPRPSR